jgi:hypothetical protein
MEFLVLAVTALKQLRPSCLFRQALAVDFAGNLYIADNFNGRVRKVTLAGIINTVAGNGTKGFNGDGDHAASAQLSMASSVVSGIAGLKRYGKS